jgi:hypothetical protein
MRYLAASIVIAAAGAVYGLFGHGVYSYYMTYAFMIPLLAGAVPHLLAAMRGEREEGETAADGSAEAEAACSALNSANALADAAAEVHADECSESTAVRPDAERQEEALSMDDGNAEHNADMADAPENTDEPASKPLLDLSSAQLAFIVTLTAGSLLKGVLDIYGTTNRLLIAYPAVALLILAFMAVAALKQKGIFSRTGNGFETKKESAE